MQNENIILGNLLKSPEYFKKVLAHIDQNMFTNIGNSELFKLIKEYYIEFRNPPNITELALKIRSLPNDELRKSVAESIKAANVEQKIDNLEFLCDETVSWIKNCLYFRGLQTGADGLTNNDDALKKKAQQIFETMTKVSIDSDLGLDFDDLDKMLEYYSDRQRGLLTQHKSLNKRLGSGFLPGTLSLFLSAAGVGKSLLMSDLISGMLKSGKRILLVSLEMSDSEMMKRIHSNVLDLPINSLSDLSKTEGERQNLPRPALTKEQIQNSYNKFKLTGRVGKFYVKDYPSNTLSPMMLEALVESFRLEKNIEFDIIFVDYLGIMKSDLLTPASGLYSYIKSIAEELRSTAKKLKVPIVSASQLNREVFKTKFENADNSSISDSMGTAMTADFMMFLLQNQELKDMNQMICKITKNRFNGMTDMFTMSIDYEHMRFADVDTSAPVEKDVAFVKRTTQFVAEELDIFKELGVK